MKRRFHLQSFEERIVPAVAIDSAYETYAWYLINELRENPATFANNLEGLINNTTNNAFGFSKTDPVLSDLRTAITNAGGTSSLYDEALALMRATGNAGPLAWSDDLETRANSHNDWMRLHGFAHTNTSGSGPAIPGYTNTPGTTDTWGTFGTFTGFGENIGYNVGGLVNTKAAYNASTFGLGGLQQRAAFLDTIGYMLELNSGSLGHLRNLLGRDAGTSATLPSYNMIGVDVDLYEAPAGFETQDGVPEAWISTHRLGFNDPAGNGGYVAGMVYRDLNSNGFYDVGEAVDATVDVRDSSSNGFTDSLVAGTHFGAYSGYVSNGAYTVTVTVNGVVVGTKSVTINNSNAWAEIAVGNTVNITGPTGTVSLLRPTTTWDAVPGATSYQIVVNNRTTNAGNLFPNSTANTNSWTPPSDLVSGQGYRVLVRAVMPGGAFTPWSSRDFAVGTPTTTPLGTVANLRPTITWSAFGGTTNYAVWLNDVSAGTSNLVPNTTVSGTSWVVPIDLVSGRSYRVWVKALNGTNVGTWNTPVDFVVGRATVTAPTGTPTTLRPTFTWTSVAGATNYAITVMNVTTSQANIFPNLVVVGTSWTPTTDLVSGNAYRVQVRALNNAGLGAWSPIVNFTIARPMITPLSTATTLQPTITWSSIVGATSYEIWMNDVTTARSNIYPGAKVSTTNWTPPTNLVNGRTYSVWIKALNGSNQGVWSNPITFKVIL